MPLAYATGLPVRLRGFCFAGAPPARPRGSSKRYADDATSISPVILKGIILPVFSKSLDSHQIDQIQSVLQAHIFELGFPEERKAQEKSLPRNQKTKGKLRIPPSLSGNVGISANRAMMELKKASRTLVKGGKVKRWKIYSGKEVLSIVCKEKPLNIFLSAEKGGASKERHPDFLLTYDLVKKGPANEYEKVYVEAEAHIKVVLISLLYLAFTGPLAGVATHISYSSFSKIKEDVGRIARKMPGYAVSVCKDGWYSRSSGSGTCSHHGGIRFSAVYAKRINQSNWAQETSNYFIGGGIIWVLGLAYLMKKLW